MTAAIPERLWTLAETAAFLGIPVATLYQFNHKGTGPRFFRIGKHCRYDPREVMAWLSLRVSGERR
jgi:predicted DNA-binding transcriptional regulator AlpA